MEDGLNGCLEHVKHCLSPCECDREAEGDNDKKTYLSTDFFLIALAAEHEMAHSLFVTLKHLFKQPFEVLRFAYSGGERSR